MKVIKPRNLGLLTRFFSQNRTNFLAVTILAHFPFQEPRALFSEQEMWPFAQGQLGDIVLDLAMPKPRGEVLLAGTCHTPGGVSRPEARVELSIGAVHKSLIVLGDRAWVRSPDNFDRLTGQGWQPGRPVPFTEMPLTWDRAFGGPGMEYNPLGKGWLAPDLQPQAEASPLPNLEYPKQMMGGPWAVPTPACFLPRDISWPPRRDKIGTHDKAYYKKHYPDLAPDMDWTMQMAGTEDQWIEGYWNGDEEFSLGGFQPREDRQTGRLPGLRPRCFLSEKAGDGKTFRELPTRLDTVWLFPGAERGVAVHRAHGELVNWDGKEIAHLVLAYEHLDGQSRKIEDYQESLTNRTEKGKAIFWLLREDDLTPPEGVPEAPQTKAPAKPRVKAAPPAFVAELKEKAQGMRAGLAAKEAEFKQMALENFQKAQAAARKLGQDPEKLGMTPPDFSYPPPPPPPPQPAPLPKITGLKDIPAVMAYLATEIPRIKAEAKSRVPKPQEIMTEAEGRAMADEKMAPAMAKAREAAKKAGVDLDARIAEAKKATAKPDPLDAIKKAREKITALVRDPAQKKDALAKLDEAEQKIKEAQSKTAQAAPMKDLAKEKIAAAKAKGAHLLAPPKLAPAEELETAALTARSDHAAGKSLAGRELAGVNLAGAGLAGADLKGAVLDSADLTGADLTGADLGGAILTRAKLEGAKLAGANLKKANLGKALAAKADLSGADLSRAVLQEAHLEGANLQGAKMDGGLVHKAFLAGADLSGLTAPKVVFLESDFKGAKLTQADLSRANFIKSILEGADLSRATAVKATFVWAKCAGSVWDGADLSGARFAMQADLSGGSFKGAKAPRANWRESNLAGADLSGALLEGGDLGRADLSGADLTGVSARKTQFLSADLTGAVLAGSQLMEASFMQAHLKETDFRQANLYGINTLGAVWDRPLMDGANVRRTVFELEDDQ